MPDPSATVLILRESRDQLEVLMLRRHHAIRVGGGSWVYPGGRLEPADLDGGDEMAAARNAAVREAREECGLGLEADTLHPIAHWTTPPGRARRYATWFFVATADGSVCVDGGEIVDHRWLTPAAALAARRAGEMSFMPPAFVTLNWLLPFARPAAAMAAFRPRAVEHFNPRIIETDAGRVILYEKDAGYDSLNVRAEGPRHRVEMRGDEWHYRREF